MRAVSNLVASLIIIAVVVGASVFVGFVLSGTIRLFEGEPTISLGRGTCFYDPSGSGVLFCEVPVLKTGKGLIDFRSVRVTYGGSTATATCTTCVEMERYQSSNDILYLRFIVSGISPPVGDKVLVQVQYVVVGRGELRVASGSATVVE